MQGQGSFSPGEFSALFGSASAWFELTFKEKADEFLQALFNDDIYRTIFIDRMSTVTSKKAEDLWQTVFQKIFEGIQFQDFGKDLGKTILERMSAADIKISPERAGFLEQQQKTSTAEIADLIKAVLKSTDDVKDKLQKMADALTDSFKDFLSGHIELKSILKDYLELNEKQREKFDKYVEQHLEAIKRQEEFFVSGEFEKKSAYEEKIRTSAQKDVLPTHIAENIAAAKLTGGGITGTFEFGRFIEASLLPIFYPLEMISKAVRGVVEPFDRAARLFGARFQTARAEYEMEQFQKAAEAAEEEEAKSQGGPGQATAGKARAKSSAARASSLGAQSSAARASSLGAQSSAASASSPGAQSSAASASSPGAQAGTQLNIPFPTKAQLQQGGIQLNIPFPSQSTQRASTKSKPTIGTSIDAKASKFELLLKKSKEGLMFAGDAMMMGMEERLGKFLTAIILGVLSAAAISWVVFGISILVTAIEDLWTGRKKKEPSQSQSQMASQIAKAEAEAVRQSKIYKRLGGTHDFESDIKKLQREIELFGYNYFVLRRAEALSAKILEENLRLMRERQLRERQSSGVQGSAVTIDTTQTDSAREYLQNLRGQNSFAPTYTSLDSIRIQSEILESSLFELKQINENLSELISLKADSPELVSV